METRPTSTKAQILYIPHGGGPLPLLGEPTHEQLVHFLSSLATRLRKPKAIVVISAHWEAEHPNITAAAQPELLYDYYGFPEESYSITYPAPGAPVLAQTIGHLLTDAGFAPVLEEKRGLDHGVFVPLKLVYPQADIPCVQLSLLTGLSAQAHLDLGKALTPLLKEPILIIGSGFSFHNMRAFFATSADGHDTRSEAFNDWLIDTCTAPALQPLEREERLANWEQAPHARYCHPREEHLLPLHVCYGIVQQPAQVVFNDQVIGKQACGFLWNGDV
ncbi:dioxygenase [Desulfobulbus rhabdoformis]|uniref:DODA-type extradiol aromatic ring-opening family dioxygenase n=1 Tax=Desulfobulbus rhabdoformis TaxID=34032 RepID=UPI001965BA97|nr:class III extradiol ring-cleavage dioxygenase [Desulfobulbus rhabdoformis]MBM9615919.1 dioxygenase [Desulfobulbus rhabdoformis]